MVKIHMEDDAPTVQRYHEQLSHVHESPRSEEVWKAAPPGESS